MHCNPRKSCMLAAIWQEMTVINVQIVHYCGFDEEASTSPQVTAGLETVMRDQQLVKKPARPQPALPLTQQRLPPFTPPTAPSITCLLRPDRSQPPVTCRKPVPTVALTPTPTHTILKGQNFCHNNFQLRFHSYSKQVSCQSVLMWY